MDVQNRRDARGVLTIHPYKIAWYMRKNPLGGGQDVLGIHHNRQSLRITICDGNYTEGYEVAHAAARVAAEGNFTRDYSRFAGELKRTLNFLPAEGGVVISSVEFNRNNPHAPNEILSAGDCPIYAPTHGGFDVGEVYTYRQDRKIVVPASTLSFEEYLMWRRFLVGGIHVLDNDPVFRSVRGIQRIIDVRQAILPVGSLLVGASDALPKMLRVGTDRDGKVIDPLGCTDLAFLLKEVCDPEEALNILIRLYDRRSVEKSGPVAAPGNGSFVFAHDDLTLVIVGYA